MREDAPPGVYRKNNITRGGRIADAHVTGVGGEREESGVALVRLYRIGGWRVICFHDKGIPLKSRCRHPILHRWGLGGAGVECREDSPNATPRASAAARNAIVDCGAPQARAWWRGARASNKP